MIEKFPQQIKEVKRMPGGDRTGPMGTGSMKGRGAGFCAGYGTPGYTNPGCRQGLFVGGYSGRGRRNRFFATGVPGWRWSTGNLMPGSTVVSEQPEAPQSEWEALKGQARYLENWLKELQARMETLASGNKAE
jgi:hypothetical protein